MNLFRFYLDSFKGLSKEVWILSLITLINRSGAMVIPFLSLYLTDEKDFSMKMVGWVMTCFGLGSIVGSWFGGYLNDKIGHFKTMSLSLLASGFAFIVLQYGSSFWQVGVLVFIAMFCLDVFRPAMFVAVRIYSKKENQTRSLSLIRLAINLGFALGPAVAGWLIYNVSYSSLFWVDGISSFLAVFILLYFLSPKKSRIIQEEVIVKNPRSAYTDVPFLLFVFASFCLAFAFLQYFSSVPIFYRDAFGLSEEYIGMLLGFNGLLVFLIEMPLIKKLEDKKVSTLSSILVGFALLALSFLVVIIWKLNWALWLGIALMSLSEIFAFPYSNKYALDQSKGGKVGQYMALYSISFSVAHVISHNAGLQLIEAYGFYITWAVMIAIVLIGILTLGLMIKNRKNGEC